MKICVVGKFPPIQGGVSMRTYWTAHALAANGHEVHVVTNAREVEVPYRVHMRTEDWARCEADYGAGSVTVHWTDPVDRSQSYIPMASPFVSKLAGIAACVHADRPFDAIYSHYLEPYGVAAYLAAQMTGAPHVVRMAGSDAGRLWRHPQLESLYDHVLRSAEIVVATGPVAERAVQRGVDSGRIAVAGGFVVPEDLFAPDGPALDLAALRNELEADPASRDLLWGDLAADLPHFGVCGKLGPNKGSFALLAALHRLKRDGLEVGLVALAHGPADVERSFRARAIELDLADRILQLPFLPHWRVPEFLRGCLAVCCLEQDFPIGFHSPMIPREVLLAGACLVASTEVLRKLPGYARLPDRYGCVAISDVDRVDTLADRLAAIARDPGPATKVGARGRAFARELQRGISFPRRLEQVLVDAAGRRRHRATASRSDESSPIGAANDHFPLTELAAAELARMDSIAAPPTTYDVAHARRVRAAIGQAVAAGRAELRCLAPAVDIEIAIAEAEQAADEACAAGTINPLFRLRTSRWAIEDGDLTELKPVRDPHLRVIAFDFDVSQFMGVRSVGQIPPQPTPRRSFIVAFGRREGPRRDPVLVDELTARVLMLGDGTRRVRDIVGGSNGSGNLASADDLEWIESLFVQGLLSLHD